MKARIYKVPDKVAIEEYSIIIEPDNEVEELALRGLRDLSDKKYATVEIDVMGIGKFVRYGEATK